MAETAAEFCKVSEQNRDVWMDGFRAGAFHNEQIFEMKRQQVSENQIWQMLRSLNIVPFKDGNQWCCLYGKDLMSGIAGFGDTPYLAAVNLYEELNKK